MKVLEYSKYRLKGGGVQGIAGNVQEWGEEVRRKTVDFKEQKDLSDFSNLGLQKQNVHKLNPSPNQATLNKQSNPNLTSQYVSWIPSQYKYFL